MLKRDTSWSVASDEDLLVRYAQEGTREAFEELVHRYEGNCSATCCNNYTASTWPRTSSRRSSFRFT